MGTDGPTFVPKSGYFLLVWVEVCLKKVGCFLLFEPILGAGFSEKILALSSKKYSFVLLLALLAAVFSQSCPNII